MRSITTNDVKHVLSNNITTINLSLLLPMTVLVVTLGKTRTLALPFGSILL
jgi:hypothetical protein